MRFILVTVNMQNTEHHPDRQFQDLDDLKLFCNVEYKGWTSLVVTILPAGKF